MDGGPAFVCSRCGVGAVRKQGHQWLCARHYRFGQMRSKAKRAGKTAPTDDTLESLLGNECPDCGVVMNLLTARFFTKMTIAPALPRWDVGHRLSIVQQPACINAWRQLPPDAQGPQALPALRNGQAVFKLRRRSWAKRSDEAQELVQAVRQRITHRMAKEQP